MKTIATFAAAALVAVGALGAPKAEARGGGGAVAAGLIGGLAAGALLGAAVAEAQAAPAYGHGRPVPAYGYAADAYEDDAPPPVRYRPVRVVRAYEDGPVYRTSRGGRFYDVGPVGYDDRRAGYGFRRDCARRHEYGGW